VVSPDAGGVKRAERLREALERRLARPVPLAFLEKFRSEGKVRAGTVVGSVENRVAIIIDDLGSTGTTLALAADACRQRGATAVYAAVTHGVFARDASATLEHSQIERLVVLDTIEPLRLTIDVLRTRVQVIGCARLIAAAIQRLHTDGSLCDLDTVTNG
jgi:ribose-phosphate pyrophosphokinase